MFSFFAQIILPLGGIRQASECRALLSRPAGRSAQASSGEHPIFCAARARARGSAPRGCSALSVRICADGATPSGVLYWHYWGFSERRKDRRCCAEAQMEKADLLVETSDILEPTPIRVVLADDH